MAQLRAQAIMPARTSRQKPKDLLESVTFLQGSVSTKDLVDLHAPVRDDDRRGSAPGAVPRHPGDAAAEQALQEDPAATSRATWSRARPSPTRWRKHPKLFDDLYVNLVAAGEVGGILDTILNRLAVYLEKADKLKRQGEGRDGLPRHHPGGRRSS